MKKLVIALAICFALTSVTWAQSVPALDQGTKELKLYGSYDGNHPLDYSLILAGGFGYFVMDNLELSGILGWQSNDLADALELGLVADYHFNLGSPWVPFLELGVLYAAVEIDDDVYNVSSEPDEDAWLARFGAGVKYFVTDNVAISLTGIYDYASADIYATQGGSLKDYNWKALLGISFYF